MKGISGFLMFFLVTVANAQTIFSASVLTPAQESKWRAILDAPPPNPKADALLDQEVEQLSAKLKAVGAKSPAAFDLLRRLADLHIDQGDFISAREFNEAAYAVAPSPGQKFFRLSSLSAIASVLRDGEGALAYLAEAEVMLAYEQRFNPAWSRFRDLWQASIAEMKGNYNFFFGHLAEADISYRQCTAAIRAYFRNNLDPDEPNYGFWVRCIGRLVEVSAQMGNFREAGAYVSDALESAIAFARTQKRDLFITRAARPVARVYLEHGLVNEAKALLVSTIERTHAVQRGDASLHAADARYLLALIEMAQGNWLKAEEYFRARSDGLKANAAQVREYGSSAAEWGYALIKLGRFEEAVDLLNANLQFQEQKFDESSIHLWEARAFKALGVGMSGDRLAAVKTLAVAVAKILELGQSKAATETGYLTSTRLNWILDGYIGLLAELSQRGARVEGMEPYAEAFRMADIARGSKVQKALSAAIVRASINDPALTAVLRKAQDLEYQVKTASEALTALQSSETNSEAAKLLHSTRAD
jgi:tetratricopeptide (TPR) repeat protein